MNLLPKRNTVATALIAVCTLLVMPMGAMADVIYQFGTSVTNNNAGDVAIGQNQLSVDVMDLGFNAATNANQVSFKFSNDGPEDSSIVQIYFDDGSLLGLSSLIDADDGIGGDPGVDFSPGASPPDLPGGQNANPPFQVTAGFLTDADNQGGKQINGVNPGEMLTVIFDLQGTQDFADVIDELSTGDLRIGIHVQGYASGGSESFINDPDPIPEPSQYALLAAGVGLAILARRKQKAQNSVA